MRSAARHQAADEPEPDLAEVTAKAGQLLDAMRATSGRIDGTLAAWGTGCPQDSRAVPVLQGLATELVGAGLHAEELRQETERLIAGLATLEAGFAAGRAHERAEMQRRQPPGPAPGRHRAGLKLIPGGVAALAGAAFTGLFRALGAHRVAAAASAGVALAATTAVLVPSSLPFTSTAPPPVAAVAGPVATAPWPSQSLAAHKGKGSRALVAGLPSLPAPVAPPVGGAPIVGPEPSSATAEGVLAVSTSVLNLGAGAVLQPTLTLTAEGGPVDWHLVAPNGLSVSSSQGHLDAGESVDIAVSASVAEVLDGSALLDIWPGHEHVTVTWEAPLPLPTDPASLIPSLPPLLGS